jgi:hypothetical protein
MQSSSSYRVCAHQSLEWKKKSVEKTGKVHHHLALCHESLSVEKNGKFREKLSI